MNPQSSKAQLRSRIRAARSQRARTEAAAAPRSSVASHSCVAEVAWDLIESEFGAARTMLAYASLSGEPDLDPTIDRFLAAGGRVFLPVVTEVGRPLMFARVTGSMADLLPQGKWGIREPTAPAAQLFGPEQLLSAEVGLDLVFIPALGFSTEGARLGNGGGFYDRTFGPHGAAPMPSGGVSPFGRAEADRGQRTPAVFGVCFDSELDLPGLVAAEWDLHIPTAVTETGIHTF